MPNELGRPTFREAQASREAEVAKRAKAKADKAAKAKADKAE